jgi:hypothetical protein
LVALVLVTLGPSSRQADAGPLPRLWVSLPREVAVGDVVRALQAAGLRDARVVMPAVHARVGGLPAGGEAPADVQAADVPGAAGDIQILARVTLEIGAVPGTGRERETAVERDVTALVNRLMLDRPNLHGLVLDVLVGDATPEVVQFALAALAVKAKAVRPALQVVLALAAAQSQPTAAGLRARDAATTRLLAYADAVVVPAVRGNEWEAVSTAAAGKPITVRTAVTADVPAVASATLLDVLMTPGIGRAEAVWIELPTLGSLGALCGTMRFLGRTLSGGLEMTAPERAPAAVSVDGQPASPAVAFVGSRTADVALLLKTGASREAPRALTLTAPGKPPQVTCFDATDGSSLTAQATDCRATADYVLLFARGEAGHDRLFESVSVTGRSGLRVEEVIARWQASRERERQALDNYSVPVFLSIHFEATNLTIGVDVALELQQFVDRGGTEDWVQTGFLVNGVRLKKGREFPLPQLEPEKVVTRPLELRLDEKYIYRLDGTDTVNGRVCYVVDIEPSQTTEALYAGRVWIDGVDFRQARIRLEQRNGRNNVASHVETQDFDRVKDIRERDFTLVRAIYAVDIVNLAGRSITVEKRYRFGDYTLNAADFNSRLETARGTDSPMFRETDEGMRALRKDKATQTRVVEPSSGKRIRALLGGVLYQGDYNVPVPLAGLTWVDFDFRGTGRQLSAFFAGPLLTLNLSRQHSKSLRWGLDLSLSALPTTFKTYQRSAELKGQRVRQFEQSVGGLVNWQPSSSITLSAQGHLYHDLYATTSDTDSMYRIPASGFSLNAYGEAKYTRGSLSLTATLEETSRLGWQDFGYADASHGPLYSNSTRYSGEVRQHIFVGKLTRGGVSAAYFGGVNLDRFSRFSPGFFMRPAVHGLPSGVDSFDDIADISAYYGFNVMDLMKLEGAYSHSWTRNKDEGTAWRQFDGLDFTIGMAGPFGTFVQGSVSVALRGNLERYKSRWGTYLLFLKPLKR